MNQKGKITAESPWEKGWSMKSYPPPTTDIEADIVIIGGGITGLLCAYKLMQGNQKIVLLEADKIGQGATLYTTAFATQVIDTNIGDLVKMIGAKKADLVWEGGGQAIKLLEEIVREHEINCEFMTCSNYMFARTKKEMKLLRLQDEGLKKINRRSSIKEDDVLPFDNLGYIEIQNQAKFHPLKFIAELVNILERGRVHIYEQSKILNMTPEKGFIKLQTKEAAIITNDVVVATYYPFNNPKSTLFKKGMYKSYVLEAKIPAGLFPNAIYEGLDNPYHYFRVDGQKSDDRIIIGGEDHRADIKVAEKKNYHALEQYLRQLIKTDEYEIVRQWAGPVLEPSDGLPLIGAVKKHHYIATAFSGNGLTYAGVAAIVLNNLVNGRSHPWQKIYDPKRPPSFKQLWIKGLDYGEEFFRGAVRNTWRK
ncbi:MAG: FAD-binding oxidoreductase [Candidatus Komeilibacteria bacterium]|nr:FAD-binding oxidoreductase [Candidatus Komeilibacteria bacterium]